LAIHSTPDYKSGFGLVDGARRAGIAGAGGESAAVQSGTD
jgi:hypothetical protein